MLWLEVAVLVLGLSSQQADALPRHRGVNPSATKAFSTLRGGATSSLSREQALGAAGMITGAFGTAMQATPALWLDDTSPELRSLARVVGVTPFTLGAAALVGRGLEGDADDLALAAGLGALGLFVLWDVERCLRKKNVVATMDLALVAALSVLAAAARNGVVPKEATLRLLSGVGSVCGISLVAAPGNYLARDGQPDDTTHRTLVRHVGASSASRP